MIETTIQSALGLGEDYILSDGTAKVRVYPARFSELDELMPIWSKFASTALHSIFLPGREESRAAFEDLLLLASGKRDIREEKDEEKRRQGVREVLEQFGTVADQGESVRGFIDRFLGLIPCNSTAAEADKGE